MKYQFPIIDHINDILPAIQDAKEFITVDKGDYKVVNYTHMGNDTFPDITDTNSIIRRECRGLIFYPDGRLMSRAFHKFFNHNERVETTGITELPDHVLEKLDGSMIRPLDINGNIRLGTKMGITDVALMAEAYIADKPDIIEFMKACYRDIAGDTMTPIFEFCSRENKIVLDYPKPQLVLLALRQNKTGKYWDYDSMRDITEDYPNIPVVNRAVINVKGNAQLQPHEIAYCTSAMQDKEGYVMVFADGHRMKAKSDWYVLLHRTKDMISREKDIIELILNDKIDDLLPLLDEADKQRVQDFSHDFWWAIQETRDWVLNIYETIANYLSLHGKYDVGVETSKESRKEFALEVMKLKPQVKSLLFALYDGKHIDDIIKDAILKGCTSRANLDDARWLFGYIKYGEKEIEDGLLG